MAPKTPPPGSAPRCFIYPTPGTTGAVLRDKQSPISSAATNPPGWAGVLFYVREKSCRIETERSFTKPPSGRAARKVDNVYGTVGRVSTVARV